MLELVLWSMLVGFICTWLAVAFIDMTNYFGILGFIKRWYAYKLMNDVEIGYIRILLKADKGAHLINQDINEMIYWHCAKRSKLMYLMMCPYCLATQLNIISVIIYAIMFNITWFAGLLIMILTGIATIYCTLNFKK